MLILNYLYAFNTYFLTTQYPIRILFTHLTLVFWLHNIQLEFSTYPCKFKCLLCTENPVLNSVIKDLSWKMYILVSDFFWKRLYKYVFKTRNSCCDREFFRSKSDDYLNLYIRNLENSRLKLVFRYTISICICVGR